MPDGGLMEKGLALLLKRNDECVKQMRAKGVSDTSPFYSEHQFFTSNQLDAAKLSKELQEKGFSINEIEPAEKEDGTDVWAVDASIEMTLGRSAPLTGELAALAAKYGSEYCGWAAG